MLIKKDGTKDDDVNAVLLKNDDMVVLDKNQFFEFTESGKTLRLFEEKENSLTLITQWRRKTVIAFYELEEEQK